MTTPKNLRWPLRLTGAAIGDFSGDIALITILTCLPATNPADRNPANRKADGIVDAVDLSLLIGAWG